MFNLYFNWIKTKSPSGAIQWVPDDKNANNLVPDAHDPAKRTAPIMLTTDLSLKFDPEYRKIAKNFQENPKEFEKAFARAWFKLTHRDVGPSARYVGKDSPKEIFVWQDPLPKINHALINNSDIERLKSKISASGLKNSELVKASWASASSFRVTDMRGGANGSRIRLEPQKNWAVNNPQELNKTIDALEKIQKTFNNSLTEGKKVSLADVIVLGGSVALEKSAREAGFKIKVPFQAGRVDANQNHTDIKSFAVLEPKADAFRNYYSKEAKLSPINSLIDRAYMLGLTVPEMTALIGGMRSLGVNADNSEYGILTKKAGSLSNDFFVNLLDMSNEWKKSTKIEGLYEAYDRKTGKLKWKATSVDLVFGSSAELRAVAEVYASDDGKEKFVKDFIKAWTKVMNADRFDIKK